MSAPQLRSLPPLLGHTRRVSSVALDARATETTSGAAQCLTVSADGRRIAAGTYDRKIYIWDVARPA